MSVPHLPAHALPASEDFTANVFPMDAERLTTPRGMSLEEFSETIRVTERAQGLLKLWDDLYHEPFRGLTSDGQVQPGLFALGDEGFAPADAAAAAQTLLAGLSPAEREQVSRPIDAEEWRGWYNPEWLVNHNGLRLDAASAQTHEHVLALMQACLSEHGFAKVTHTRKANAYLGDLYDLGHVLGEWSYHFMVYGSPSETKPWGWSLYGHHLNLSVFIRGGQIVISPSFLGTEPTIIESEDGDSFRMFGEEAADGLALMQSLSPELRRQATVYAQMRDPAMPEGRWHFADERQLGGAFQDNRVVPYEGIRAAALDPAQRELLLRIAEHFLCYLPDGPRTARLAAIEAHLDSTWWSWIGGHGDDDPFYYRIQSPVVMLEFDHHSGVWLTNPEPAKYHVHTIARTPNGGDYGKELLRQHRDTSHPRSGGDC